MADLSMESSNVQVQKLSLSDFELVKYVGNGAFSKVYVARFKGNKICALKVVGKEYTPRSVWIRESKAYKEVKKYPFLLDLMFCFQTPSKLIYVTKFIQGGDLATVVRDRELFSENETRFYTAEIALAVNYLHERHIMHRDIKLENIMICMDGHLKLIDYGLCKVDMKPGIKAREICGTRLFMAPEIHKGRSYDFSADWYSLGVTVYIMLMGVAPYKIESVLATNAVRLQKCALISQTTKSFVAELLKKNPLKRLGSTNRNGFQGIVMHPFFDEFDWNLLESKEMEPPFIPRAKYEIDFNAIGQPIVLDHDNLHFNINQKKFEEFDYYPSTS